MKKILAALLATALFATAWVPAALAEEENLVRLYVQTADGAVGDEVEVEIAIDQCNGMDSLQCNINYDGKALSVEQITPGTVFPAEFCITNADEENRIRMACASAEGIQQGGTVLTIRFKIQSEAGSAITLSDVRVTCVDEEYHQSDAYLQLTDGGVSVSGGMVPAAVAATPWIAPTPIPTPSPEPSPTPEATPMVIADEATSTPELAQQPVESKTSTWITVLIGVIIALVGAAGVIVVVSRNNAKKKRRRKKRPATRNEGSDR